MTQSLPYCSQKKVLTKFTFCLGFFIVISDKQANIHCNIGSISRPICSHDPNFTNQAISIDRYQRYFRKLDNFFSGKQQYPVKTDQKNYSFLIYDFIYDLIYDPFLSNDSQSSYVTFGIFNNSTFFDTIEKTNEK